jgi:hypothetical protein
MQNIETTAGAGIRAPASAHSWALRLSKTPDQLRDEIQLNHLAHRVNVCVAADHAYAVLRSETPISQEQLDELAMILGASAFVPAATLEGLEPFGAGEQVDVGSGSLLPPCECQAPDPNSVAPELRDAPQWITWKKVWNRKIPKWEKPPTHWKTGHLADARDPANWTTFANAHASAIKHGGGVGFSSGKGIVCVDIDADSVEAASAVARLFLQGTFIDGSPSGKGLHGFIKSEMVGEVKLKGMQAARTEPDTVLDKVAAMFPGVNAIEIYSSGQYLTVVGHPWVDSVPIIAPLVGLLDALIYTIQPPQEEEKEAGPFTRTQFAAIKLDDAELWQVIKRSTKAAEFNKLYGGDTKAHGGDTSVALFALLENLAFWLDGDAVRMDAWFRRSAIYSLPGQADKWERRGKKDISRTLTAWKKHEAFTLGYCHFGMVKTVAPDGTFRIHRLNEAAPVERAPLRIQSAATIRDLDIPPMVWAIENLLPSEGVVLLGGRPKEGKSWMALQFGLAITSGHKVLGFTVTKGRVLYLALEDNDLRMRNRLDILDVPGGDDGLDIAYEFTLDPTGIAELAQVIADKNYNVVIVDTFMNANSSVPKPKDADPIQHDYAKIIQLKKIAFRLRVCIVLVCHTRKGKNGDVEGSLDGLLGTTGIPAAADQILKIEAVKREAGVKKSRFYVTGKDSSIDPLAISLDPEKGGWLVDGFANTLVSAAQQAIMSAITGGANEVGAIAEKVGKYRNTVWNTLDRMVKNDALIKDGSKYFVNLQGNLDTGTGSIQF